MFSIVIYVLSVMRIIKFLHGDTVLVEMLLKVQKPCRPLLRLERVGQRWRERRDMTLHHPEYLPLRKVGQLC